MLKPLAYTLLAASLLTACSPVAVKKNNAETAGLRSVIGISHSSRSGKVLENQKQKSMISCTVPLRPPPRRPGRAASRLPHRSSAPGAHAHLNDETGVAVDTVLALPAHTSDARDPFLGSRAACRAEPRPDAPRGVQWCQGQAKEAPGRSAWGRNAALHEHRDESHGSDSSIAARP